MKSELVAVGEPISSAVAAPDELINCRQPGAPRKPRSMPGLIWPKLSRLPLITAVSGMLLVVQTSVEPRTGAGAAFSASANWSGVVTIGSETDRSMLPGSSDGPPGEQPTRKPLPSVLMVPNTTAMLPGDSLNCHCTLLAFAALLPPKSHTPSHVT